MSNFGTHIKIDYQDILADTYKYKSTDTLDNIFEKQNEFFVKLFPPECAITFCC